MRAASEEECRWDKVFPSSAHACILCSSYSLNDVFKSSWINDHTAISGLRWGPESLPPYCNSKNNKNLESTVFVVAVGYKILVSSQMTES